jgi:hypothetical protein
VHLVAAGWVGGWVVAYHGGGECEFIPWRERARVGGWMELSLLVNMWAVVLWVNTVEGCVCVCVCVACRVSAAAVLDIGRSGCSGAACCGLLTCLLTVFTALVGLREEALHACGWRV